MKVFNRFQISFLSLFTNLTIFLLFIYPPSDFDLGWHLRYGEYFWQHFRLLRENLLSYTLPNYLWTNTSWSYDIWLYPLFKYGGFLALAIAGAIFPFLVIKVIAKAVKASHPEQLMAAFIFFALGGYSLNESLRARHPSFLAFAVLYLLLAKIKNGQRKFLASIPLLFLIAANLHGQSLLGLLYLFLVWLVQFCGVSKEPRENLRPWILLGLAGLTSGLATLINPYGIAIFTEALKHASNPFLRHVYEYYSLEPKYLIGLGLYLLLLIILLVRAKKLLLLKEALPLLPLAYLAFQTRRNMAFFVLFSLPLAIQVSRPYLDRLAKSAYFARIFSLVSSAALTALIFRLVPFDLPHYNWGTYCQFASRCSEGAVQFLKQNLPSPWYERGFNWYDWSGHLIWRLPEIKPFIDGRMHLWQSGGHYIMGDHSKLITATEDWEGIFQSYDFTWALVPPFSGLAQQIDLLVQRGTWERVYEDENAVIYFRLPLPPDISSPTPPESAPTDS